MYVLTKAICRFNVISVKTQWYFFTDVETEPSQNLYGNPRIFKAILKKRISGSYHYT